MFAYIYDWLWNFVCYMILITAVMQALPENTYHKYLRFFCGLILILLFASPLMELFGMQNTFHDFYQNAEYRRVVKEMELAEEHIKEAEQDMLKEGEE